MRTQKVSTYYKYALLSTLFALYTHNAHAYLDPGTGSMLLAIIIGIVSTLLYIARTMWHNILIVLTPKQKTSPLETKNSQFNTIVCYSEGAQYWNTFAPVIEAISSQQQYITYLTSDQHDPGLEYQSPYVYTKYIGKGNRAYTYLNLLHATICVLTTPNLDTLQIRRSKRVSHYAHVVHAPTDLHLYKLYAFDFYDSFFVSGLHQEKSLRHLETIRSCHKKQVFRVGCPYMDILHKKTLSCTSHPRKTTPVVLIASTWGESGLLYNIGEALIMKLTKSPYDIIVRPHPQSYVVENHMIEQLQQTFLDSNITWDNNLDNFDSMNRADILISDRSGITLDFSFVFEKPILTYNNEQIILKGTDGNDIPWQAWELDILPHIGAVFTFNDINTITEILDSTIKNADKYTTRIRTLRKTHLYNYGNTQAYIIDALNNIKHELEN